MLNSIFDWLVKAATFLLLTCSGWTAGQTMELIELRFQRSVVMILQKSSQCGVLLWWLEYR